jgi:hypothetical protein
MKFITKKMHALIDYPVALALIILPFVLGLGESNLVAFYASVATGVAALLLTLITDHQTGVIKIISYKLHLIVDFMVGLTFIILPLILSFQGIDLVYYLANGAAILFVVGLQKSEQK